MRWANFTSLLVTTTLTIGTAAQTPTAVASNGIFVGVQSKLPGSTGTVNKFLGMPYAVPITKAEQRFTPAQTPAPNSNRADATTYKPGCIRVNSDDATFNNMLPPHLSPPDSEDCLYINVYAPSSATTKSGLPVMFWIYGGSFTGGNGTMTMYDGSYLAASQNVIVVTFNYRLAIFGWPGEVDDLLLKERNVGSIDTRTALDWTKANIAAFGGNPNRITVFGESAGSIIVDLLALTTSPDKIPFQAMIMESGTYFIAKWGAGLFTTSPNAAVSPSASYIAGEVGCPYPGNTAACLRDPSITTAKIKAALDKYNGLSWGPREDGGANLPVNWNGQRVRIGNGGAKIPMLTGTNANEALLFTTQNAGITWDEFFLRFPELADNTTSIKENYSKVPCEQNSFGYPCLYFQVVQAMTDYMYTCLSAREARANAAANVKTWRYVYNTSTSLSVDMWGRLSPHAFELPQVFGTYGSGALPQQKAISAVMMKAWADFAKDPLGKGPGWDSYSSSGKETGEPVAHLGANRADGKMTQLLSEQTDSNCKLFNGAYEARDPSGSRSRLFRY